MNVNIKTLRAKHGDAIIVEIDEQTRNIFRILIDGGPPGTMAKVNHPRLKSIQVGALIEELDKYRNNNESFDITVLTHIDDDHIGGILAAYKREEYRNVLGKNIWFNSARLVAKNFHQPAPAGSEVTVFPIEGSETSIAQGVELDDLLELNQKHRELLTTCTPAKKYSWGTIHVLSPTRPQLRELHDRWVKEKPLRETSGKETDYDKSIAYLQNNDVFESDTSFRNGSSIALLIQTAAGNLMFLGDAFSSTVCKSLRRLKFSETNRLKVEVCKISHHGSKGNTCAEFLSLVDVNKFIISTNGGKQLPDKQTIARILKHSPKSNVVFNYPELKEKIFTDEELAHWRQNLLDVNEIILKS